MSTIYTDFAPRLVAFATTLTGKFALAIDAQPEDQLKPAVEQLITDAANLLGGIAVKIATEVRVGELAGRPDMGVTVSGLLVGYVELKAPGKGADPAKLKGSDKDQWAKFQNLPNVLYTDGNEWALYRSGERIGSLHRLTGNVVSDGATAIGASDAKALLELLREFLRWEPITPNTPKALAELLAPLCRLLRTEVLDALQVSSPNMSALATDWRTYFFPDADDHQFADAYAQTLTYALLLARVSGANNLSVSEASRSLRTGHRLLADVLKRLGDEDAREEIKTSATLLERVITAIDPTIFSGKQAADPWLYFYEDFLAAYDPKMRKDRGVYYTPVEVVQCQVRLIAQLLAERFGKDYSFCDEHVTTLDPATGTGTYILAALQHGLEQVSAIKGPGAQASAATQAARNMHAFELLIGPYAVAHLRLTQQINAAGGVLPGDGVHVYLTDTLESPNALPPDHLPLPYRQLAEEHQRALKIKKDTPVLVCIGNPPYDRQTIDLADQGSVKRKGGWVRFGDPAQVGAAGRPLLDDFIEPLKPLGLSLHAKNLYNDYVYFWRWALWKVFEQSDQGYGIVSFITAASYLRGDAFAGMRQLMRQTFDELWIIDLEGDNLGARKSANVFAIQTPVAIAIGVRAGATDPTTPATVHYTRIEGSQAAKLAALAAVQQFSDIPWQPVASAWTAPFLPRTSDAYLHWPLLTDLFPWQVNGVMAGRTWPIAVEPEILRKRWRRLCLASSSERTTLFKDSPTGRRTASPVPKSFPPAASQATIAALAQDAPVPELLRFSFRSFDRQWLMADGRLLDRASPDLWRAHSDRQIYLTSLLTEVLGEGPAAVVTSAIPDKHHFRGSFGGAHVIPLYRDAAATQPNVTNGVLSLVSAALGMPVSAERLFTYAYALLATPRYVERFWEALATPGPRLPLTRDRELFNRAADLGERLIWLHTYCTRCIPEGRRIGKVPPGTARCLVSPGESGAPYPRDFGYNEHTQELRVGSGRFAPVRPEVWSFSISGLNVVDSWLGYRMENRSGRSSSPLDEIRPTAWQFDDELLELLWVLEATVDLLPQAAALLDEVIAGPLWQAQELPIPGDAERAGPKGGIDMPTDVQQQDFLADT